MRRLVFRTTVEVDPGQRVVSTGPYEWVRHPSYAGLLLIVVGFGLAEGNWPSTAMAQMRIASPSHMTINPTAR